MIQAEMMSRTCNEYTGAIGGSKQQNMASPLKDPAANFDYKFRTPRNQPRDPPMRRLPLVLSCTPRFIKVTALFDSSFYRGHVVQAFLSFIM